MHFVHHIECYVLIHVGVKSLHNLNRGRCVFGGLFGKRQRVDNFVADLSRSLVEFYTQAQTRAYHAISAVGHTVEEASRRPLMMVFIVYGDYIRIEVKVILA